MHGQTNFGEILSLISNKHDLIKLKEKHNNKNHNKIYWISGNNEII